MKNILVPIDGSKASEKAAEKSIEIAKLYNSKVTFLSVTDVRFVYSYSENGIVVPIDYSQTVSMFTNLQTKMLDDFTDKIDCAGIPVEKVVLTGIPSDEIIQFANESNCDLIVMGRRGFSKIKRFFVGSVTQRVISDAPCPVLVINDDDEK